MLVVNKLLFYVMAGFIKKPDGRYKIVKDYYKIEYLEITASGIIKIEKKATIKPNYIQLIFLFVYNNIYIEKAINVCKYLIKR